MRPLFGAPTAPPPRPGKVKRSGEPVAATAEALAELARAREEAEAADKRAGAAQARAFKEATDSEFWFCVCFSSRYQKEDFLRQLGLLELGDKYFDAEELAEALRALAVEKLRKIKVAPVELKKRAYKPQKALAALAAPAPPESET